MMSMPFLILSGLGTYMYVLVRRGPVGKGRGINDRNPSCTFRLDAQGSDGRRWSRQICR